MKLFSVITQEGSLVQVESEDPPIGRQIFRVVRSGGRASVTLTFYRKAQLWVRSETGAHSGKDDGSTQANHTLSVTISDSAGTTSRQLDKSATDTSFRDWNKVCSSLLDVEPGCEYQIIGVQWNVGATANGTDIVAELRSLD
ncbi:MAG: hypothetical protein DI623_12190 [Sphingomonas sanxanigenens]|uniref:Uncharacterized protein n=1 Tax=Sphingomonas sanxanigenens TaxID=397260 RepID=A0A2W5C060_9SPHN|nr:MAG: hypothetical protein DI623_12190 [Sphingomonas sanxanigenens]